MVRQSLTKNRNAACDAPIIHGKICQIQQSIMMQAYEQLNLDFSVYIFQCVALCYLKVAKSKEIKIFCELKPKQGFGMKDRTFELCQNRIINCL